MHLKKITIQAFGPFKDKVQIDFEKNNIDKGLLLITGDTGAGKTSIFDAICFALYGEASSSLRKVSSLRSDFSKSDIDTYVELEFYHKNKLYTIKRSPEYERKNKRKEGTTKQPATASFEINGRIETKTSIVTKEIEQLLGLDYKQFHQVTMLSQGEFTKFLLAPSDEKTSIFRKIFNTDIYNCVMTQLKEELNNKNQSYNTIKDNISKEREKLSSSFNNQTNEELINNLENQITDYEKNISHLKKERETLNKHIQKRQSEYDKQMSLNNKIKKYNDVLEKLENLLKISDDISKFKIIVNYNRNIALDITSILKNLEQNTSELNLNNDNLKTLLVEKKQLDDIFKNKQIEFKKIFLFNEQYENLNNELLTLIKYQDTIISYQKYQDKLEQTLKEYKITLEEYKKEEQIYINLKENYYSDMAYVLSSQLKENEPCPVCGSITHPHIKNKQIKLCTKEELNAAEITVNDLATNIKSLEVMIDEYKNNIKDFKFSDNFNYLEELTKVKNKIAAVNSNIDILKTENKKLVQEKEELNNKITKATSQLDNIVSNIKKQKQNIKKLNDDLQLLFKENNTSLKEYNNKKIDKPQLLDLENQIKIFENSKNNYETTINLLSEEVSGKKIENLDLKQLKINELIKSYQIIDEKYLETNNKLTQITSIKNNLIEYNTEYRKIINEYSLIKNLSDTANGKLVGKQRITFENYVQSYYLNSVLVEANKRLSKMTDNRYELKKKEYSLNLTEKLGLEFSVFDSYTGKERDVSSLSGGEKFTSSLALALGLSDVISMHAGGIKMNCLFVDEGFGSLDLESLNQALNTLVDLVDNDKLVGIISHVTELVSRIDNKICVTKGSNGSNLEVIS